MARAPERPPDRQAQLPRQIVRLVEPAPETPPRMQRHRHDRVRAGQQFGARQPQPGAQRPRQRATTAVLEDVEQVA
jgi:hypothetical protein